MKKWILFSVLAITASFSFVSCSKNNDEVPPKEENKNYPETVAHSSWATKTFVRNFQGAGTKAKMELNFIDGRKLTINIYLPEARINISIPDYYLYGYQNGKGTIYSGSNLTQIKIFYQNNSAIIAKVGDSYVGHDIATGRLISLPPADMEQMFNSASELNGNFTITDDKLTFDSMEFFRE